MIPTALRVFISMCRLNGFKLNVMHFSEGMVRVEAPVGVIEPVELPSANGAAVYDDMRLCARVSVYDPPTMSDIMRGRRRGQVREVEQIFDITNLAEVAAALVNVGLATLSPDPTGRTDGTGTTVTR